MRVAPDVFADPQALGRQAAELVADGLERSRLAGRPYLLGCPGGRSAATTYAALAQLVGRRRLDLGHLVVVMMDDYLVPGPGGHLEHEDDSAPHSCIRFGREEVVAPLNRAAGRGRGMPPDQLWVPDPAHPDRYDDALAAAGGVDLFLLASGAGDGHVAFNAPGSPAGSRTRVVSLPDSTRRDNLATFPTFGGRLDAVPGHGVTVGIDTIVRHSASVLMLVSGPDKGRAAARLCAATGYDPAWPATVFAACARPRLFLDDAARRAAAAVTAPVG
ncbi:glucosamine-6-phosphate deaminase [Friedmanniella luteola]|uniref:Glucosamine-6-phosphate deaminase n=1 Tax=Friedmanniella luteola TaxID=546871 RepID=A0A1H1ZFL2_9ACTN|nr:6-phosphogluconolactonase [Friedmanniella luteola]SDT32504.1 glucosamine-6-phosphate deaminase [Friedmanniella luteola]